MGIFTVHTSRRVAQTKRDEEIDYSQFFYCYFNSVKVAGWISFTFPLYSEMACCKAESIRDLPLYKRLGDVLSVLTRRLCWWRTLILRWPLRMER